MQKITDNIINPKNASRLILKDMYFYTQREDGVCTRASGETHTTVTIGEKFGIFITFVPCSSSLKYSVRLTVPHSVERFPTVDGVLTFTADRKTVLVEDNSSGINGFIGFYWGLGLGDPIGWYEIMVAIEGRILGAHKFQVLSGRIESSS